MLDRFGIAGWLATRLTLLATSILILAAWVFFGFDSVMENVTMRNPETYGVGLHWSTLHAAVFLAYVSMINLQVGGLKSVNQLVNEIRLDLRCLFSGLSDKTVKEHLGKENGMPGFPVPHIHFVFTGFVPAFMFSCLLAVFALFVFEYPYVFMLNWFHYEDLFFPIYYYNASVMSPTFIRNTFGLLAPLFVILITPRLFGYVFRIRLDRYTVILALIASVVWMGWIIYPSDQNYVEPTNVITPLSGPIQVWPKQDLFPQTIYIYLNVSREVGLHERDDLDGFYLNDPPVHLFNVLTKYLVYLAVGYMFMPVVRIRY